MREFRIIQGDALEVLKTMPAESVHCCVTSPPYWGLRDYGTGEWMGGLPDCDHVYNHGRQGKSGQRADRTFTAEAFYKTQCAKCGAIREDLQIGLEATPEKYTAVMVEIFAEVRRVLRDDGTLWLNLGDSYNGGNKGNSGNIRPGDKQATNIGSWGTRRRDTGNLSPTRNGGCADLKVKDLVGIPWRVAFALQADGWYLRSDIIWHKPNPMPESVTDRPTKAHEYLFLFAKSERYFYDTAAIAEPSIDPPGALSRFGPDEKLISMNGHRGDTIPVSNGFRNKRSVWTVTPEPYAEAHFATMPTALAEPCIMAGCPEGGIVLDPFAGSGTTGVVATRHARDFIGIELNPEYVKLARNRIMDDAPMFNQEYAE